MALSLPELPEIEKVSTSVIRILGGNPSKFTLQGTNTYLLGTGSQRILLDTGQGFASWKNAVSSTLSKENCSISDCLLTHWHMDHILGVDDLKSLPNHPSKIPVHKHKPNLNPDNILDPSTIINITDNQTFSTPDKSFSIRSLYTPGHAQDHMCFLITQSTDPLEVGSIFTADNVLGHGTAVFEDLATYLSTLAVMRDAITSPFTATHSNRTVKAYPGHGAVIDNAAEKIQEYLDHRKLREEEALNVLRYGTPSAPAKSENAKSEAASKKEWDSMDMVKVIYQHYPENLWEPAEKGLLMVLDKLRKEGRVTFDAEHSSWTVNEKAGL